MFAVKDQYICISCDSVALEVSVPSDFKESEPSLSELSFQCLRRPGQYFPYQRLNSARFPTKRLQYRAKTDLQQRHALPPEALGFHSNGVQTDLAIP
jgi:hypothetical protein